MKISVKLERDVLILKMDEERSFSEQKDDVEKYLLGMKNFLSKGNVKFAYDGAELTFDEEVELCAIADKAFEREVDFCHKKMPPRTMARHMTANGEKLVKKITGTVKAGEIIESNGDMLVLGDVNPTAQLVAQGDIYVIGNLRGVAHAGCTGDEKAIVYAMNMNPVMVKIADKIGFNSSISTHNSNGIAAIENGEVKVKLV